MNPSGQLFITVSLDNTMKLWKLKTHELVYSFKADEWGARTRRDA